MVTQLPSARHQVALGTPTGSRRATSFTFRRGGVSRRLEPVGGSLTQDARRAGRWDGRLSFVGDDLLPRTPNDLLTPFGTFVDVELGLELLDGSVSTVPYGTYEIISSRAVEAPDARTVDVGLGDLSGIVDRYRFESPLTVSAGTDLGTMVNTVVRNRTGRTPGLGLQSATLGAARTFGLETSTGPWDELLDVLDGFSRTAWYNRTGQLQMGTTTVDPNLAYPLNPLASLSSDFDTKPANVIVARGEDTGDTPPVQATAMDTDPTSPTYAGTGPGTSPYGRVTQFYSSPLITTVAQAQSAANTILARTVGAGATHTVTLPYDPTISAGDVVSRSGSIYVVDCATVDITGQTTLIIREV